MTSLQKSLEVYLQSKALILTQEDAYRNILIVKLMSHSGLTLVILDPQRTYVAGKANLICFDEAFDLVWQADLPPVQRNALRAYRDLSFDADGSLRATDCVGSAHRIDLRSGRVIPP